MKNFFLKFIFVFCISNHVLADVYQCDFSSDIFRDGGQKNSVTCAKNPHQVFSRKGQTYEKWKHCQNEKVFTAESTTNMIIDTDANVIYWTEEEETTEYSRNSMYRYYIKKGETESEAKRKSEWSAPKREMTYLILNKTEGKDKLYYNEKLKKAYDPPKSINTLILTYGDERGTGSIYIPRVDHGQSIMADYVTADNDSWVKLKFGHCEYVG